MPILGFETDHIALLFSRRATWLDALDIGGKKTEHAHNYEAREESAMLASYGPPFRAELAGLYKHLDATGDNGLADAGR